MWRHWHPSAAGKRLTLLERHPFAPAASSQAREYTGAALPPGAKLWSKAGWTSETRHDAASVELPTGERFVLVTFTVGHAKEKGIIPAVARWVLSDEPSRGGSLTSGPGSSVSRTLSNCPPPGSLAKHAPSCTKRFTLLTGTMPLKPRMDANGHGWATRKVRWPLRTSRPVW